MLCLLSRKGYSSTICIHTDRDNNEISIIVILGHNQGGRERWFKIIANQRCTYTLTLMPASGISEHNVTISTEPALPIEGAFVAGFTVFSLLTMFFYVSVAHIR